MATATLYLNKTHVLKMAQRRDDGRESRAGIQVRNPLPLDSLGSGRLVSKGLDAAIGKVTDLIEARSIDPRNSNAGLQDFLPGASELENLYQGRQNVLTFADDKEVDERS
jgi:hypothetical protein